MKVPNYDITLRDEIEKSILSFIFNGSIISPLDDDREHKAIDYVINIHSIDNELYFRNIIYKEIFSVVLDLYNRKKAVDYMTISKAFLKSNPEISFTEFNDLFNDILFCSKSFDLTSIILIFKEYILQDFLNNTAIDIIENNWDQRDVFEVLENIENSKKELFDKVLKFKQRNASDTNLIQERWDKIKSGESPFIPLPVHSMQIKLNGLVGPELTIIGARPAMGKTTFSFILALYAAQNGYTVRFISLEMSKIQMINRVIAFEHKMPYDKLKSLDFNDDQEFQSYLNLYKDYEENSNLKFYDQSDLNTIEELEKLVENEKTDLLVVDYLQLLNISKYNKQGTREQEISLITRKLKTIATVHYIPVVALSQLSRRLEERVNKRPILSDLRESGSIEQNADNVWFLYREGYYLKQSSQYVNEIEEGNTEIIQAKGRESKVDVFKVWIGMGDFTIQDSFKESMSNFN